MCDVLGIKDQAQSVRYLDDDEKNTLSIKQGNRGNPTTTIINESDLYP
ncbi:BRO family protein [Pseudodesulfovibrio methanolicus]|uniref:BRO family protein n=1 Tax=Pseudodesulfovibrio methanolicus TaxID=3126690 RepID=A0ABZ2J1U6_9BACT